jgi:hypothetical protein
MIYQTLSRNPQRPLRDLAIVGLVSLMLYVLVNISMVSSSRAGSYNYYMYLAEAFLNGSLALVREPPSDHDLSLFRGRLYLYWGPTPAVLLIPLVWLFGADWSDAWLTIGLAAANNAACFFLLASTRALHGLTTAKILLLTSAYGFGSPLTPISFDGTVWFTGQLFTNLFLLLAVALTFHPLGQRTGYLAPAILFGLSCSTRMSVAGAVLWFLWMAYSTEKAKLRTCFSSLRALLPALSVFGVLFGILLWYNFARFGNPFDVGVHYHKAGPDIQADIDEHGLFSLHYLLRNFYYHYIAYPYPPSRDSLMGASLFLMTPLYFGAFFATGITGYPKEQRRKPASACFCQVAGLRTSLFSRLCDQSRLHNHAKEAERAVLPCLPKLVTSFWVAILLIALPSLTICGTGWSQIGARYTLDYAPFLLLLVAVGIESWPIPIIAVLTLVSIAQYLYGLLIFT